MDRKVHRLSIFSQSLDYAAVLAFLLGGVVPFAALAYVAQHYVLPDLEDRNMAAGLIALIFSIGVLSLASYLVLQRFTRQSLRRMERDNRQLQAILEASRALAAAPHRSAAGSALAACARSLTECTAALVMVEEKEDENEPMTVLGEAGREAAAARFRGNAEECARLAIVSRWPIQQDPNENCPLQISAVAFQGDTRGAVVVLGDPKHDLAESADSLATLAALASVSLHNSNLQDIQRNFFVQLTDVVVSALDHHLGYHEGHSRRVAHITNRIGHEIGLGEAARERLHFASLLHDIGMLKIPIGKHTDQATARTHTVIGHKMLAAIRIWEDLAPMVLHHHERFDGSGYPEALSGEQIPLEARIIGLAEAVDTMTSKTSYKEPVSTEAMLQEVRDCSGTQFDPRIAETFLGLVERGVIDLGS